MARPTARGVVLLIVAATTYAAARVLGTWELYLLALAFAGMTGISWVLVHAGSRRLEVDRSVQPERPVAGDPLRFDFEVSGGARVPGLQVILEGATGGLDSGAPVVVDGLGPGGDGTVTAGPWPARRGVHRLPAFTAVVEDSLGLARARRVTGEPLQVTVVPRLDKLRTCAACAASGARHGGGRRRLPTRDAWELRGIRPHDPGEPLSRVDWKSTAKTGNLMIREMESAAGDDLTVVLSGNGHNGNGGAAGRSANGNGGAGNGAGHPEDGAFETAVRAAGSMAAYALRAGRAVSLLLPEQGWKPVHVRADGAGRRRLLLALAEAQPGDHTRLGPSLQALVGGRTTGRQRILALVVLSVDEGLVRAVLNLRRQGVPVSIVHVAGDGAAGNGGAGDGGADGGGAGLNGLRDALAAAGVHYVRLARGDDLRVALAGTSKRRAVAR